MDGSFLGTDPSAIDAGYNTGDITYPGDTSNLNANQGSYDIGANAGAGSLTNGSIGGVSQSVLSQLAKAFGMTDSKGNIASGSLLTLLSMLGIGAGALNSSHAIKTATNDITGALATANKGISDLQGNFASQYAPYASGAAGALSNLQGMTYKPIAGNFQKVGTPANQFNAGGTKLVDIMRKGN